VTVDDRRDERKHQYQGKHEVCAGYGSAAGWVVFQEAPCQDALPVAVVRCISAIRALLAFSVGHHSAHNFLVNGRVAILLKSLESQVTPELLSPIYSRSVPARSGCVRRLLVPDRKWHPSLEGRIDRDVPPLTTSVGIPIKPS
jgi:hypothetical protein